MKLAGMALALLLGAAAAAAATPVAGTPADAVLGGVSLEQRIGESLPLTLSFTDDAGGRSRLGEYFHGKPVIVAPVWYSCPNLCSVTLDALVDGLAEIDFEPGRDFEVVAVSIDPRDDAARAAELKADLLRRYGRAGTETGWHLLTGDAPTIRALTDRLGFGYRYDETTGQYAHPATLALASADGRITRYLPGVEFPPDDLRLALVETGRGQLGSVVDRVLLRCFSYDPATGRYTLAIVGVLRLLGVLTVLGIGTGLAVALIREHRRRAP